MIETVLVPTDGSDHAGIAVDHGVELGARFDATVHVLHIVDVSSMETVPQSDESRAKGEELVNSIATEATRRGVTIETAVRTGTPSERILEYTSEEDIDLVTMGTYGRTGVRRYLLGSVAEKVVRLSDVPVLTVRRSRDRSSHFPYDNVVVPTDGSQGVQEAIGWAITIAKACGGTIHALSVIEPIPFGIDVDIGPGIQRDRMQESAENAVARVVEDARDEDLDTTAAVTRGRPHEEIVSYIDEHHIDLVVMGTRGRSGIDRYLLGSVAEKTVRTSPVSVMTVRQPDSE